MKVVLEICDMEFKTFEIADDAPTSKSLAMTMNGDDGQVLLMRFRHVETKDNEYRMILDSAYTPADEHISGIEAIVKAGNAEG